MKKLHLNIRINKDQKFLLDKLGGPTKGFETMLNFYIENYDLSAEYEMEMIRKENIKKIKGRK